MLLAAVPGHWPVGELLIASAVCCLSCTRLPPLQRGASEGQGTNPAPHTKDLHNNQKDIWKHQNCTCRCNGWEQVWGAEEDVQSSHPLFPTVWYIADIAWWILKHQLPSGKETWGDYFSPFSFAFWFLLRKVKRVCLDTHCPCVPSGFFLWHIPVCEVTLYTSLSVQCRASLWWLGLNRE